MIFDIDIIEKRGQSATATACEHAALYGATPGRDEFDTLVAIAGGKDIANPAAVIERLDKVREKYADMVLVHGGAPGVEKIAAGWAEKNGVHQIVCKPDWDRHGRAAPFRRNDELLNLLPKGVIAFPGSGITENLVDKAKELGIPVDKVAA